MSVKHHVLLSCVMLLGILTLSGCRSTGPDFTPPDGYTLKSRDRSDVNLYFVFHTNRDLTKARSAEMREAVEHYFRRSKRFHIWWQKDPSTDEDVVVNVHFETMQIRGNSVSGMGAKVTLSAMCNHHSGLGGDSLLVQGFSKPESSRNSFVSPTVFSIEKHFTEALNDALFKLRRDIEQLYPISSRVRSFHCDSRGRTELTIAIGTDYGLSKRYEYLVCCGNQDGFSVLGLAEGTPGAKISQLRVTVWNREAMDFESTLQRIRNNDKSLTGSLFVIARVKPEPEN